MNRFLAFVASIALLAFPVVASASVFEPPGFDDAPSFLYDPASLAVLPAESSAADTNGATGPNAGHSAPGSIEYQVTAPMFGHVEVGWRF